MEEWEEMKTKLNSVPFRPRKKDEELLYRYNGTPYIKTQGKEILDAMKTFEVREDDIFLITYPKAGTTWTQEIVSMVLSGGNEEALSETHLFFRFPFIEMNWASHYSLCDQIPSVYTILDKVDSPRTIKTHLLAAEIPPQVYTKKPKIIYVARNPKDVAVSYFHMHTHVNVLPYYSDWNKFLANYMKGEVLCGSWYDHTLFWWKKRHETNVLFLKFEDMKQDLRTAVEQVATFLGAEVTDEILDFTVRHCSFKTMKTNRSTNPDYLEFFRGPATPEKAEGKNATDQANKEKTSFMRKGTVGDWKNYFTVAQNEIFDAEYKTRMEGSGLHFDFELQDSCKS